LPPFLVTTKFSTAKVSIGTFFGHHGFFHCQSFDRYQKKFGPKFSVVTQ